MRSYRELQQLARQHIEALMAEAAAEQLAKTSRSIHTSVSLRQHVATVICALAARLEPTAIQAELIEACPTFGEWVR